MLGDHHRLRKHLREHGRSAGAEVLDFKQRPWTNTRGGGEGIVGATKTVYRFKLRVRPEDEPPFDAEITDEWSQFSEPRIGMTVGVLYDPKHQSKVVLDAQDTGSRVGFRQQWQSEVEPDHSAPNAGGEFGEFAERARAFAEQAAAFREGAAALRSSSEGLAAIARAKEAGNQAEAERLTAELKQRMAGNLGAAAQGAVEGSSSAAPADPLARLQKLADLRDRGVLNDEEFAAEKAKILEDA